MKHLWTREKEDEIHIVMELKPGNVHTLMHNGVYKNRPMAARVLLRDMLEALDYLAHKGFIHGDVKPENILYKEAPSSEEEYEYQLADFSLASEVTNARMRGGTWEYMAPELMATELEARELIDTGEVIHTEKADVWSLFVTVAVVLDPDNMLAKLRAARPFEDSFARPQRIIQTIQEAACQETLRPLKAMADCKPRLRATAGYMLDLRFGGRGRTTQRSYWQGVGG